MCQLVFIVVILTCIVVICKKFCCYFENGKKYYATILNENTGCHLALGYAYEYGIKDLRLINNSDHHVDLVFGDDSTNCIGITRNGERIVLFENGKYVGVLND